MMILKTTNICLINKMGAFVYILNTDTQMKFYKILARPVLLYGSETWVTTTRDMTRLEAAEMQETMAKRRCRNRS
jgi:hypothetical protein